LFFFLLTVSPKYKVVRDDKGFIFIDRDGKLFEPIISYLRTGKWRVPPYLDLLSVLEEAEYFGINPNICTTMSNDSIRIRQEEILLHEKETLYNQNKVELEKLKQIVLASFDRCITAKQPLETPRIFKGSSEITEDITNYLSRLIRGLQPNKDTVYQQLVNGSPNAIFDSSMHQLLENKAICEAFIDNLQRENNLSIKISCTRCEWNRLIHNVNYYPAQSVSEQGLCYFYVISWSK
jgi:hypothetical protein